VSDLTSVVADLPAAPPAASVEVAGASAPFRPGPVSRLLAWLAGRPGAGLAFVLGSFVAFLVWGTAVEWLSGRIPPGTLDPNLVPGLGYAPYSLGALILGRRIGLRALDDFWPATGWPESARPEWAYRLANAPARSEWAALAIGFLGGVAALASAPPTVLGPEPGRVFTYIAFIPGYFAGYTISGVAFLWAARWIYLVAGIHRGARAIDPFDRTPIYAFSRLTVFLGIAFVFLAYYSFTVNVQNQIGNVPSLTFIGATIVLGIVTFIAPLWGIHGRLVTEKDRLALDVERRVNRLATEIYGRIDAGSFEATTPLNGSLAGLITLRDRIAHLPTWPWPPNVLRGFLTALLLPIAVFVAGHVITTLIGT